MSYSYEWSNEEHSSIKRTDEAGNIAFVPVAEGNRDYAEFLASGAEVAEYAAPPAPPAPTAEEKLAASGLTVDELRGLLGL